MASTVKQLQDSKKIDNIYPITLSSAVFMSDENEKNLDTKINEKANLNSPSFTGAPTAPTPSLNDNSDKIATTAFVTSALSQSGGGTEIIVSSSQPPSQSVGDFWYKEV